MNTEAIKREIESRMVKRQRGHVSLLNCSIGVAVAYQDKTGQRDGLIRMDLNEVIEIVATELAKEKP